VIDVFLVLVAVNAVCVEGLAVRLACVLLEPYLLTSLATCVFVLVDVALILVAIGAVLAQVAAVVIDVALVLIAVFAIGR